MKIVIIELDDCEQILRDLAEARGEQINEYISTGLSVLEVHYKHTTGKIQVRASGGMRPVPLYEAIVYTARNDKERRAVDLATIESLDVLLKSEGVKDESKKELLVELA